MISVRVLEKAFVERVDGRRHSICHGEPPVARQVVRQENLTRQNIQYSGVMVVTPSGSSVRWRLGRPQAGNARTCAARGIGP
jgi:hypothetical protein